MGRPAPKLGEVETILLVGEDGSMRRLVRAALERWGYRVLEAANGKEALWLSETHAGRIHLLVCQPARQHLVGRLLAEELLDRRPGLKSLQVTGSASDPLTPHRKQRQIPSDPWHVTRCFRPDRLLRAVREALDGLPHGE